jgi:D-sedoheptulose 7-phosphate isomerase
VVLTRGAVSDVEAAFARREPAVRAIAEHAADVALVCRAMAERFDAGGRLLVFGNGAGATDAGHVAVEFVHPVIVGKRALPAVSLASDAATLTGVAQRDRAATFADQVAALVRPPDIAMGILGGGDANVRAGLDTARATGALTVALVAAGAPANAAEHVVAIPSDDPLVVKEANVTAYHVLWELVHVFLDAAAPADARGGEGLAALYPFLYGGSAGQDSLLDAVAASTVEKVSEVCALRDHVGHELAGPLAGCAAELAEAFAAGATLWTFGNGGSSTDAQDVARSFLAPAYGRPLPALCLTGDAAVLTALSNDIGFDVVFSRQLEALGRPGDIAFALSTSGGSDNVLSAIETAARLGMRTVGLGGYDGGRMAQCESLEHLFAVPSSSVHRIQEVQTTTYHVFWELVQQALA